MDASLISLLIKGSLMDPILWVLGAVIGWDHRRAVKLTASFLVTAGCLWGAIRAAVYMARGESLGMANAATLVLICLALMVFVGLGVREARWLMTKV